MSSAVAPSFSSGRKWLLSLSVFLSLAALLAIVAMLNYMAARHFNRFSVSRSVETTLSPLTHRVLEGLTNQLRVTVFFDKSDPLYESVLALLKEYRYANQNVSVQTVDYLRDPSADLIKTTYKLTQLGNKNLIIFEYDKRTKFVQYNELSRLDVDALIAGQSKEIKRTHFNGELMFTSAIFSLVSARPLKAYFLQTHNEHPPESDDAQYGYSKFAAVLKRNNVDWARLDLSGPGQIPGDCSLLIIAGPSTPLLQEEVAKIGEYLQSGGRLLMLFNFYGLRVENTDLLRLMAQWGVLVGRNVVRDPPQKVTGQDDFLISRFGLHPVVQPLLRSALWLRLPRSVRTDPGRAPVAGAPDAVELFYTSDQGTVLTDIREGIPYPHPGSDTVTNVCLAVAVEKGRIRGVTADRGTTRMIVVGESLFLSNGMIDSAGNSDFASAAVNWLLDRSELLGSLGPRPITEYRTTLTSSQMTAARLLLILILPGSVLTAGTLVWFRRRS